MSDVSIHERLEKLRFFQTPQHECNYLPDRHASTLFADPNAVFDANLYSKLAVIGFRRSGRYLYRPRCQNCNECIPIRIACRDFKPNRSQRRNWKNNQDLDIAMTHNHFNEEHYALYAHYLKSRHPNGGMDNTSPEKYRSFLNCSWMDTCFVEFRLNHRLISVAVTDFLDNGISALYTFFDPRLSERGLGTFAILWQLNICRQLNKSWVYLGYWIEACTKMSYKTRFKPYETFFNGHWYPHE